MRLVDEAEVSPSASPSAEAGTEMKVLRTVKVPPDARLNNAKANTKISATCFMTKIPRYNWLWVQFTKEMGICKWADGTYLTNIRGRDLNQLRLVYVHSQKM